MNMKKPPGATTYGTLQATSQEDKVCFRENDMELGKVPVHEAKRVEQATASVIPLQKDGTEERLQQLKIWSEYIQLLVPCLNAIFVVVALPVLFVVALIAWFLNKDATLLLAFIVLLGRMLSGESNKEAAGH